MGTCSSAQKKTDSTVKAPNGVSFKAKEVFISSPIKEKALSEDNSFNLPRVMSSEFGSKEEKFFDSKVWLDTDGEDEFLSVNGDFTPSRRSTPNHESMKPMTPKRSTSMEHFPRSKPETSSTGRKKLAELLRETSQGEKTSKGELQTEANGYQNRNLKAVRSSAYGSGDGAAAPCCLPSLLQNNGFNEKRRMNPLHCCA